ncbi:MAG: metallophosphoesterase family protein [Candidatus Delongbacteria bacterium]|nr:metallophosphoesterase family protein [Candidatus Delongbacteria bacterium]MBN2836180.1 metallophosphoesterase family protein [Candidatus Delongbacteria bacterium]
MRRFAVFTDIHGNIEALKAIYSDIISRGISEIYHLGDAIAIGPEPKLTMDFILSNKIIPLKGNHEIYYTDIVNTGTTNVPSGELIHQKWVAEVMGDAYYETICNLDYEIELDTEGVKIHLCHYPFIIENGKFKWFINFDEKIDRLRFTNTDADIYFFGHQHNGSDEIDKDGVRYVNLSSAGATKGNTSTYALVEIHDNSYDVIIKNVEYDKAKVIDRIDELMVPEKEFIKRIFFGVD